MPELNPNLGRMLRGLISKSPRSQRWLSQASGLSLSTLNLVLSGERECAQDHLRALLRAFPDQREQYFILLAHLQDEAAASGLDASRVLIRYTDGADIDALHLDPALNEYLGIIARRLKKEADLVPSDDLIAPQIEWLSQVIVRLEAMEADLAARVVEFDSAKAAEHPGKYHPKKAAVRHPGPASSLPKGPSQANAG